MLALTTALALVGPPAAAAASGPSKPNPSTPGPLNARASDPMEPELAGLRRQLAETQAALDSIATRVGLMSPQAAATGPASGQPRSGPAPYTRTQLLSTLSAAATAPTSSAATAAAAAAASSAARELLGAEQQLRTEVGVALQRANHLRPDGGTRLPEAEAHYRWGRGASGRVCVCVYIYERQ